MMQYRILDPNTSETGDWQLEYRENFVWTVECFDSLESAASRREQIEEEERERDC